ncbi:MAG: PEP-CTERM sorting domain-containing protein [bacterium]
MKENILKSIGIFTLLCISILLFLTSQVLAGPMADWGDNPDTYSTLDASNGPYHLDGSHEWLGINPPDYENDGQPTLNSDGDDANFIDDEDGITFVGTVDPVTGDIIDSNRYWGGLYGQVDILAMVSQWDSGRYGLDDLLYIDGWFDWTHDGDYDESGIVYSGPYAGEAWSEHAVSFSTDPSTWGQNSQIFSMIFLIGQGPTGVIHSRWRLSYDDGSNEYFGMKTFGEVEDYGPIPDKDQSSIPEPATMLLLGFSFIAFIGIKKKV